MTAAPWVPDAADIADLPTAAADCRGCELWEAATQVVFSAGNPRARLALSVLRVQDADRDEAFARAGR